MSLGKDIDYLVTVAVITFWSWGMSFIAAKGPTREVIAGTEFLKGKRINVPVSLFYGNR